jgi:hypothetical protein
METADDDGLSSDYWAVERLRQRTSVLDVFEGVALVGLAAVSCIIAASIAAGIVVLVQGHATYGPTGDLVGIALRAFGAFGNEGVVLLLLVLLGFVWWRVSHWTEVLDELNEDGSSEDGDRGRVAQQHLVTLRWQSTWTIWLMYFTIVGSIASAVSLYLEFPISGLAVSQVIISTAEQAASVAILIAAAVLCGRLTLMCDMVLDEVDEEPAGAVES